MKRIKIALTGLALILAVSGVVVAKANEKKRLLQTTVYFRNIANDTWFSLQASSSVFDQKSGGTTATIASDNNGAITLYASQSLTDQAKFVQPN